MTEEQFSKTMIEYIKYEYENNRQELLTILRRSQVNYNKTSIFTKKSYQCWEDIDLRVPIPMIEMAKELKKDFDFVASQVYLKNDDYDFKGVIIKPKSYELQELEISEHDVVFEKIKEVVIQGIRDAKYTIWVAVAWFTDRDIFSELKIKKQEGLNVRIITSNEEGNRFQLSELKNNFDIVLVDKWGGGYNRLHDKFCIIDLEYVMHGSYNWSRNASKNKETWATAIDKDFVRKFCDEFLELYSSYV